MEIQHLSVRDFRNFASGELDLGPRFTVLYGENGAGKTNLVEALYLVSTLRSFRVSELGALIREGAEAARVELSGIDSSLDLRTQLGVNLVRKGNSVRRSAIADGKTVRSAKDFYGRARAILFTPEDLGILRGSPSGRRNFLDRVIFARERTHISDVQGYEKALRSRNHVLRKEPNQATREHLAETYEVQLADFGARIWDRREALVSALRGTFIDVFSQIHGAGMTPAISYQSKLGADHSDRHQALKEALHGRRSGDLVRRTTTIGPHRDDLGMTLNDRPVGAFASQGQTRALILAFKIAEVRSARNLSGEPPLLLLDDVSSELDPLRNAQLFEALTQDAGQCVLTTTAPKFVHLGASADAHYVEVLGGQLRPVEKPS